MDDNYYLKIGGTEVFSDQLIDHLSSDGTEVKKKADAVLSERLKETRVRVGTLLKTDNVSFLIGAGASMDAGGVGLASIPLELEKSLHKKTEESGEGQTPDWLSLFYVVSSAITSDDINPANRREDLAGDLSEVTKIPINLEDYLSHLHMWRSSMRKWQAGTDDFASNVKIQLAEGGTLDLSKPALDQLILEISRSLTALVDLPVKGKEGVLKNHRRFIKKILTRPLNPPLCVRIVAVSQKS